MRNGVRMKQLVNIEYHKHPISGEWYVTDDNYDGAEDGNNAMGAGTTKYEALTELLEKLEVEA